MSITNKNVLSMNVNKSNSLQRISAPFEYSNSTIYDNSLKGNKTCTQVIIVSNHKDHLPQSGVPLN